MYDVAIIGTGAAGISAALTLQARGKSVALLGKGALSQKMTAAEKIRNYPGLGIVSGGEMAARFAEHLRQMDIGIIEKHVTEVNKVGDHFCVLCGMEVLEACAVILATGVCADKPFPNEEALLGKGVSYCATCDGFLYENRPVAVVCTSKDFETDIEYLAQTASKVYLAADYPGTRDFGEKVVPIPARGLAIRGTERVEGVETQGGAIDVDALFILRDAIAPGALMKGLAMDGSHIRVNRACATSIEGCFAAGDCTGRPYQYVKAAGEGNVAAHSALEYLAKANLHGNAKTRPFRQRPLSFRDAVDVTDLSGLPTDAAIRRQMAFTLTKGEVTLVPKDTAGAGDVIAFSARGGKGRFDRENLRLTLGQNLYDYEVERALPGKKVGEEVAVVRDGRPVTIHIDGIFAPVGVIPTDEMVRALGDPEVTTLEAYFNKMKAQAREMALYGVFSNVMMELMQQAPEPETTDEIQNTLSRLETDFFDNMFRRQLGKGLYEMTPAELQEQLHVDSVAQFVEIRRDWYHTKHKQVLVLSEALNIPLEGQFDYLRHYEALSLLQQAGVQRLQAIIDEREG